MSSDGTHCLEELIASIYGEIAEERPWLRTLEQLRALIPSNTIALQLTVTRLHSVTYFFAAGKRVESADIATWEHADAEEKTAFPRVKDRVTLCNDWRERSANAEFMQLLRKYDVLRTMTVFITEIDAVRYHLHACRSIRSAPFSSEDERIFLKTAPHFERAIKLRRKLQQAEFTRELQADAMDRLAIGGIVLDSDRSISVLNEAADRILRDADGLEMTNHGLRAGTTGMDKLLQGAISDALSPDVVSQPRFVRAMSIERPSGRRPYGVVVNRQRMRSLVSDRWQNCVLIFIHDPESRSCEDTTIYRQLFRFTRTESLLAAQLAAGCSIEEAQRWLNVSRNTIRAHLRSMFTKTGVSSRAELIRLLVDCVAPLAGSNQQDNAAPGLIRPLRRTAPLRSAP